MKDYKEIFDHLSVRVDIEFAFLNEITNIMENDSLNNAEKSLLIVRLSGSYQGRLFALA
jgi:hypothetical protein